MVEVARFTSRTIYYPYGGRTVLFTHTERGSKEFVVVAVTPPIVVGLTVRDWKKDFPKYKAALFFEVATRLKRHGIKVVDLENEGPGWIALTVEQRFGLVRRGRPELETMIQLDVLVDIDSRAVPQEDWEIWFERIKVTHERTGRGSGRPLPIALCTMKVNYTVVTTGGFKDEDVTTGGKPYDFDGLPEPQGEAETVTRGVLRMLREAGVFGQEAVQVAA